ncbi:sperm motility kinase 3A-like [Danio aesculapii]|uniref:sperm motility kinase 3A-like n=1 Tax=Danio aesculapii TaxID=1142201 RepID=UPI0024BF33D9|nr:sperm motility kinase 3A-like [Danio aesculapii]
MLVMEYLATCKTLEDFLEEHQHLEERDARSLFLQIVKAAQQCLRREICHCDIHDCNILVISPPLHIKIIDFGLGKRIFHDPEKYPPDTRISPKDAVKTTVNQLYFIMSDIARRCSSTPADFRTFINACYTIDDDTKIQHTVEQILDQPWLRN